MSLRRVIPVALLLLLVPLAAASGAVPPEDAPRVVVADRALAHWAGVEPAFVFPDVPAELPPGEESTLWFGLEKVNATGATVVAFINVTSEPLGLANETVRITIPREEVPVSDNWRFGNLTFTTPEAPGPAAYNFTVELYAEGDNETVLLGAATGGGTVVVAQAELPVPPPAEGLPVEWIVAGAAVLVVGGGAAAYVARQRAERRRMNAAPRRSTVMRDLELERKLERAKEKAPEEVVQIQQEIRAAEQVREQRRELQILEAKRADALKTLDLLKKRHEAGGLTKLQYENMVAKKKQDLARIEAEIAAMERGDGSAAA